MDEITQFFDAIGKGDATAVGKLLAADPALAESRNRDGATAVLWAAYTRHFELVEHILGTRDPDLYEACALGKPDRVARLLQQDPKLANGFSQDGFSALGLSVYFGHLDIARILVAAGADVNEPSRNSIRVAPLHSAIESGSMALLELLLQHGATPDVAEFLDATPLHSAAARGSREMVERLLAAGADRHRKTKDGKTPADLAREYGHPSLAAELQ